MDGAECWPETYFHHPVSSEYGEAPGETETETQLAAQVQARGPLG